MSQDTGTLVRFRREKSALEMQAEIGKRIVVDEMPDRWVAMGSCALDSVPVKDSYIFINGISYLVLDSTMSIKLGKLGQPVLPAQALVTVKSGRGWSDGIVPLEDFYK